MADDEIIEAQAVAPLPLQPTAEPEREGVLDALRGFALFGILLVNLGSYAHPFNVRYMQLADASAADQVASFVIRLLADSKFYALFSFLFGVGMALQEQRAQHLGREVATHQTRRLGILAGIGLLHGLLLWAGDILLLYAVVGFAVLLMRRIPERGLRWIAAGAFLFPLFCYGAFSGAWALILRATQSAPKEAGADFVTELNREIEEDYVAYQGTLGEVFVARAKDWLEVQAAAGFGTGPQLIGLFLLGLLCGRHAFQRSPRTGGVLLVGVLLGLPLNALYAFFAGRAQNLLLEPGLLFGAMGTLAVGAPLLAAGYAALFVRGYQRATPPASLRLFEPLGRMALTNYLLQSLVCTTLFYGYGGGLYGKLYPAAQLAFAVALFVAQLLLSHLWLGAFRFGPVEWLWRSLTYGERQPLRRRATG